MRNRALLITLIAIVVGLLASCGSQSTEQDPTVTPVDLGPTASPTAIEPTWTPQPTATPAPTQPPTQVPTLDPSMIDNPPDWDPQLVLSSPAAGEESLLDGAITLRFDQPMDASSVEEAFSIEPEITGDIQWPRPDLMIFTPRDQYERAQTYQVNISNRAMGTNGRTLREAVNIRVQTVGELEVSAMIPADDTGNVDIDGAITVLFNRPVVPLVATQDQAGLINPINVVPPIEGKGEWISTSIYRFTPTNGFAGATNYEVTVAAGLTDVTGAELTSTFVSNFVTQQPRVETSRPFPGQALWPLEAPMSLSFNMAMDPARTEAAIGLDPSVPLTFEWNEDNTSVVFTPTQRLEIGTTYTLLVTTEAAAASGQGGLDETTRINFDTVPLPRVVWTDPIDGDSAARTYNRVSVEFSAPMDWSTIEDRVIIKPEPERVRYNFFEGEVWLGLNFAMQFNTDYTITIPGDAADPYGNPLGEEFTFSFTTAEAEPFTQFTLPFRINQFSASFAPQIDLEYLNVDQLDFALFDAGLPINQTFYGDFWDDLPNAEEIQRWSVNVDRVQNKAESIRVDLNDGEPLPTGVYLLTVDSPQLDDDYWRRDRRLLVVTDTNLVVKETVEGVYVWATDMATGQPAPNRLIALYNERFEQVGTGETDRDGFLFLDINRRETYFSGYLAISETPGQPGFGYAGSGWAQSINPWNFGVSADFSTEPERRGYMYTDRPLYRPGDTVEVKGIYRDQDYGRYSLPATSVISMKLMEMNFYGPNQPFEEELEVEVLENGTFVTQFTLPEDVNPGQYQIFSPDNDYQNQVTFQVAEFRKPEFEVSVESEISEALTGTPVDVAVQADYFFGGPAADLELNYTVYADNFQFGYPLPYSFGILESFFWYGDDFGSGREVLLSGGGRTDADGTFIINLPADLLSDLENGSRNVTIEATVFDVNFQPFAARTNITFHQSEVYVGIQPENYLVEAGDPANFSLVTVDWDGEAVGNIPTDVTFYRREWERNDDGWYEAVDIEIESTSVTTDENGEAQVAFTPETGGSYKAVAISTDGGGRTHESAAFLWVSGAGGRWRIEPNQKTMEIVPDKQEYAVGETANLLIQSPFEGPITAWLSIDRGKLIEQRLITLQTTGDTLAIPVTLDHVPNMNVTIIAIKGENALPDGQLPGAGDYADIRVGMVQLPVKIDPFKLNIELIPRLPESGVLQPGETAEFDVIVTNENGQPIPGTFSLALVDKAIFALASDNVIPIEDAFYDLQPLRTQLGSGMFYSGEGYERPPEALDEADGDLGVVAQSATVESEIMEESAEFAADAVAAPAEVLSADDSAKRAEGGAAIPPDGIDVRTDFRDTALWEAEVTTDGNGRAVIEIPLPDNLTTWNLHVKAINNDTLVGQASTEVTVQKPILLRPITPRFLTVGDVAEIGTVINNNTNSDQALNVLIEGTGFEFVEADGGTADSVTVPANGSVVFRQPIRIIDRSVDFVDLTFTAWNDSYSDASKPTFGFGPEQLIPVYRYNAEDITATSGVLTDDETRRVEAVLLPEGIDADFGDLVFKLNGSLAAAVLDGLEAHNAEEYNSSCAHAYASRLLPNATTARAITQLNLDEADLKGTLDELNPSDIANIVRLQRGDGGWSWCSYPESSPWFSAYVLLALDKAQEAGYEVPADALENGIRFLQAQMTSPERLSGQRYQANAQAFYHYVLAELDAGRVDLAAELFTENRENLDAYAKAFLLMTVAEERLDLKETILADISGEALVSATGAHWEDNDWSNLSSDIRATAIMIMAFSQVSPDEPFGPQAVNWLMGARQAQVWGSRHDTTWVLLALTDWLVSTDELEGDYTYSMFVNGTDQTEADSRFNQANIAETETLPVPIGDLTVEEINFVELQKQGNGRLYYNAYLDTFIPADLVGPIDRGIAVERRFYDAACTPESNDGEPCAEITEIEAGQQIRVELTIIAKRNLVYAVVEDYFPAGAEAIDPNLPISQTTFDDGVEQINSDRYWGWWGWWYFNQISYRDERITFTANYLPQGTYKYTYNMNAVLPGTYQIRPTFAREEFTPEVNGRGAGEVFTITAPQGE